MTYTREDFKRCHSADDAFYCPGCNATPEDFDLPSVGCPCSAYGTGTGSLTQAGVDAYLKANAS